MLASATVSVGLLRMASEMHHTMQRGGASAAQADLGMYLAAIYLGLPSAIVAAINLALAVRQQRSKAASANRFPAFHAFIGIGCVSVLVAPALLVLLEAGWR
jgi:hypothetical protein